MGSIQGRLLVSLLGATAIALLIAGLILNQIFEQQFEDEFDRALLSKAETLAILTTQGRERVEFDFADELMPAFEAPDNPEYFELRFSNGELLEKSRSLGSSSLLEGVALDKLPLHIRVRLGDGRVGRMAAIRFIPHMKDDTIEKQPASPSEFNPQTGKPLADIQIVLAVAKGTESLQALNVSLHRTLAFSSLGLLLTLAGLTQWLIRYSLRPLTAIASEVSHLDSNNLTSRIRAPDAAREVLPIVTRINELLARLEQAFEKEKRFSSNAAHELKTPIAEFRTLVEVAQEWRDDKQLVERYFRRLLGVAERMDATVSTLLLLTRLESRQHDLSFESIQLKSLIDETLQPLRAEASQRGVSISAELPNDFLIDTDTDKFRIVLSNLASNAVAYAVDFSTVTISCARQGDQCELVFENECQGLTQADLQSVFDRFWRRDEARTGARHAGLGLTLVKLICDLLGYQIQVRLTEENRFIATLCGILACNKNGGQPKLN